MNSPKLLSADVENFNSAKMYSAKEICEMCKVNEISFRRFISKNPIDIDVSWISSRHNPKNGKEERIYSEKILDVFGLWLEKNAINTGKTSEVVKQNLIEQVEMGAAMTVIQNSGDIEAAKQFCELIMLNTQNKARANEAEKKLIEAQPKIEVYDNCLTSNNLYYIGDIGAELKGKFGLPELGYQKIFTTLCTDKIIKRSKVYKQYNGLNQARSCFKACFGYEKYFQTKVTADGDTLMINFEGVAFLIKKYAKLSASLAKFEAEQITSGTKGE